MEQDVTPSIHSSHIGRRLRALSRRGGSHQLERKMSDQSARPHAGVVLTAVAVATLLACAGCSKSSAKPEENRAAASSAPASAPATEPASEPASEPATEPASEPSSDAPTTGTKSSGKLASADRLLAIKLPMIKGAPANAVWTDIPPSTANPNGDRYLNLYVGEDVFMSLEFLDCRLPKVQAYAGKPLEELGIFRPCFDKPNGKLKGYPLYFYPDDLENPYRTVKAGHVIVIGTMGPIGQKIKGVDMETLLGSLPLATIRKM
ncbi:hypothetical protein J5X84_02230 [Streptosporangiaceae bacterium NEAU-GS5]|nr:hypothetical protein [Streptosporangiaceae bacterium NEAU-GS5]